MIKLKNKGKRKEQAEEEKKEAEANGEVIEKKVKQSPGELRLQKELADLDAPSHATVTFPDPKNIMSMHLVVNLKNEDSCYWKGGIYKFSIDVPASYPHDPPKCMCITQIYHPNIDL